MKFFSQNYHGSRGRSVYLSKDRKGYHVFYKERSIKDGWDNLHFDLTEKGKQEALSAFEKFKKQA